MKKIYLLLALVIFMSSCEKEEVFEIQNESSIMHFSTVPQKDAINFLKNVKKSNSNKQSEIVIHYDQLHYDTINNSTELLTVIPAQSKFAEVDSRVLVLEVDGNIEPVLFNLVPEIQNNDTLFTGKIIISNLDLKFITGFRVKNGNLITQFGKKENPDKSTKCQDGYWEGIDMDCYQTLGEVTLNGSSSTGTPYISISHIYPNSGGGYDDGMSWAYPSRGGGGGGITNPIADEEEEVAFEDKIDDTNLNDCLKSILDKLKGHDHGVGELIEKFAGRDPNYNWTVKDGLLLSANAQTSQSYNRTTGTVTTIFDPNKFSNASDLSAARTILHESVHAYIVASFGSNYINASNSFAEFFDEFNRNKYPTRNDTDHAEFARNYVGDIAVSLQQYGERLGLNLTPQFYEDLAWGGLTDWPKRDSNGNIVTDSFGNTIYEETPWFNSSYPSSTDRKRIKDVISIEQTGKDNNGNTRIKKGSNTGC